MKFKCGLVYITIWIEEKNNPYSLIRIRVKTPIGKFNKELYTTPYLTIPLVVRIINDLLIEEPTLINFLDQSQDRFNIERIP